MYFCGSMQALIAVFWQALRLRWLRRKVSANFISPLQLAAVKSGAVQLFGVNLGSWLVLEQYMVPSIYAMVSGSPYGERQLMQARRIPYGSSC